MGEADEQVIGVMQQCGVCRRKTLHSDGVCREHTNAWYRRYRWWFAIAVLAIAIYAFGSIHVLYGREGGIQVCSKIGWTLTDTFVDREDISSGKPFHTKVFAALDKCLR